MELDHIFVRVAPGAPEAEAPRRIGLLEGSGNTHPGQGTANRRFFLRNAFIELLWVADAAELASERTRPTRLGERLADAAASPFGICFRPAAGARAAPFPAWSYVPAYLPPGMTIEIARDAPLSEPMWFHLAAATAPEAAPPARRQPLAHPVGLREITSVVVTVPGARAWSAAAQAAIATGRLALREGEAHLLEIGFDGETCGRVHDLRPALPLVLRY